MRSGGFKTATLLLGLAVSSLWPRCGGDAPPVSPPPSTPPAFTLLSAASRQIVNASGERVRLRGFNLGGWLVKEGYILHFPGPAYDSPSEIDQVILDLAGPPLGAQLLAEYREQWIAEADLAEIAALGFNSVRLPIHHALLWDRAADHPREEGFAFLDRVVSWCEAHRLWLFLDLHCAPGGQNGGNISDSDGTARLYTDVRDQEAAAHLWRAIATRYRDRDAIGGYDLLNEPVWPNGGEVAAVYRRLALAVREADARHLIILEGNTWATDFSIFGPPFEDDLVFSFHKYWNATDEASIEPFLRFSERWNVPLWLGETGENDTPWYRAALGLMRDHQIGWCFWPWKKVQTDNGPLSVEPAAFTFSRIVDYLDGRGPKPTAEETAAGLREMLRAAQLPNCRRNADLIATLQAY